MGHSFRPGRFMILELEAEMRNINGNLCWMINAPGQTSGLDVYLMEESHIVGLSNPAW